MLTCTTKDGKEIKLKNKEFKKYFAAAQAERVLAEVMKALKENAKELEADGHSVIPPEHYILDVKLPSEFVVADPTSLAGVTAEPGTEPISSTGIKYAFNSAFSITEVLSVNLNWPSRVKF